MPRGGGEGERQGRGPADRPIRIGVSSCLLGCKVRFDGGHKKDDFLVDTFGKWVQWVPVCPEVEVGMGTPRESIRLIRDGEALRLLAPKSGTDWTAPMREYASGRVRDLEDTDLCGYVLKKDSPSCGMERVKVYGNGMPTKSGRGVFAEVLLARLPDLPVEEEGRLNDPRLRDNFVERVFAYHRLKALFASRWTVGSLVAFHTAHKLQLMAHSPQSYTELGRLVAGAKAIDRSEVERRYREAFMQGLRAIATPRRNTNVLQHILGYFRKLLDAASRRELLALVDDYHRGLVPLVVPITLIRHYVRLHGISYLAGQSFLDPHPKELMLRNHV
ncbi:MAG: YbgA family protein [Acidobacteriota bacterium]